MKLLSNVPAHHQNNQLTLKNVKALNQYMILKKIGKGSTSKVYLIYEQQTKEYFVLKCSSIKLKNKYLQVHPSSHEINILQHLSHPNIIKMKEHFVDDKSIYLIEEYGSSGTLDQLLKKKRKISEELASFFFQQVAKGLLYLHKKGIVHHDMKPANLVISDQNQIKIIDFGLSNYLNDQQTTLSSPSYQAPEVVDFDINVEYDQTKEDVWSFGISLFESVFGYLPWDGEDVYQIAHNIHQNPLIIPSGCSNLLKDLIEKTLSVDQGQRISSEELVNHPFFNNEIEDYQFDKVMLDLDWTE
jgi:serine/threonine protein kinase